MKGNIDRAWNVAVLELACAADIEDGWCTSRREQAAQRVIAVSVPLPEAGEALHSVGLELKRRGRASGASRVLVTGLADDAMGF